MNKLPQELNQLIYHSYFIDHVLTELKDTTDQIRRTLNRYKMSPFEGVIPHISNHRGAGCIPWGKEWHVCYSKL